MKKYGSVYTPDNLADFATFLIISQMKNDNVVCNTVLDPACEDGSVFFLKGMFFERNGIILIFYMEILYRV